MEEIKLNGESKDIVGENIDKLKELFPEIVTEGMIDFDKFKQVFSNEIDDSNERYDFTWAGKSQAIKESQKPSQGTLIPSKEDSKNWDTTQNLYIEGDNLEVLKLLQKSYYDKIKMIYIDPPYNTGNDFIYQDNYKDNLENYLEITGQVQKVKGERERESFNVKLSTNTESHGRFHSNWLNMMYPRLKLARNLLSDDGVIFISIDDNEVENLKKICYEIFGEENFVSTIVWRKKRGHGRGNSHFILQTEYILVFAKKIQKLPIFSKRLSEHKLDAYKFEDSLGRYKRESLEHHSPRGAYERKTLQYPIFIQGKEVYCSTGQWLWNKEHVYEELNNYINEEKTELKYLDIFYDSSNRLRLSKKIRLNDENGEIRGETPLTIIDQKELSTNSAASDIKKSFGSNVFDFSKPVELIKQLIEIGTLNENDIVLDFFSGSGTAAVSTLEINNELNRRNKFILVQLQEINQKSDAFKKGYKTICEIGKERIRRAGDKIIEESGNKDLDIGFKVFKLNSSNLTKWNPDVDNLEDSLVSAADNIVGGRTSLDLVYEIMLKYGLELTLPVEEISKDIFSVAFGSLVVCLRDDVDENVIHEIFELVNGSSVSRVVFKDNGFKSDSDKTNIKENLRVHGVDEFITI